MLLEAFVALIALATVMIVATPDTVGKAPGTIYGAGLGRFLAGMIGQQHLLFATTFGAMAFSTFVFDTLDVSTRLGRYILQELLGWTGRAGALAGTAATVLVPAGFLVAAGEGSYRIFWTLFGTSNQLLAALTLLGVSVWLRKSGRRYWYTMVPMVFVMTITVWSLVLQVGAAFAAVARGAAGFDTTTINGVVAVTLLALAAMLVVEAAREIRRTPVGAQPQL